VRGLWRIREARTVAILLAEILFFTWYLWPEAGRAHPFLNGANGLLILKYSSVYGIAAVGAAMVIISGGVDLSPGAVIALAGVVAGKLFVEGGHSLGLSLAAGLCVGVIAGAVTAGLVVLVGLPPFIGTLGVMGIARGVAFIVTEGRSCSRPDGSRWGSRWPGSRPR
jgi:ribose/xylose/arabinose/galactoside ABC-type transport system permease subunit